MILWIGFLICTFAIVFSGTRLSKYGDIISEKTGLGRSWTGVVLMASVTSLPELATGISSVTYAGVPNIALGDVLGSCVFNMLILAFLDALYRPMPLSSKAHHGHVLSAGFGILLLSIVAAGIAFPGSRFVIGWIGPYTLLIALIYFLAMRMVYFYEKRQIAQFIKEVVREMKYKDIPVKTAVIHYGIHATVVVTAALFLPEVGKGIAQMTGLGQTFVGNIFIAVSTSLPEVVVCVAAVRIDAVDLAIGNLFGSNIFNIFILGLDDVFFAKGPLLSFVSQHHMISAMSAIAMTAIAVIGSTYRSERKPLFMAWDSISISLVYVTNLMLLYTLK
jgi:cation:H+ antiporter